MNKPVQVTIGEPLASFVRGEMEHGGFDTPEAVVEAGLRLLEAEQAKYAKLREALIEGEQSGEPIPFDPEALMASVRESWRKRG
ncbi:type II toxin-antitoxin system ParD family antitoxin [Neorhizobium sp. JUb45]|uniref:type II toxin-antitoxin system ParD family antitoxin n=1 Tax=unclassified Neorhizobium TaxID=2629175 RepID=UPI00104818A7|nr:type II toxin-antitoxin system ParD family antitoxin [Neorhizobium sp. JUb45]TCR04185.1 antitoxin ParD1/3/4 [Neorhizobium sp. JUb45]